MGRRSASEPPGNWTIRRAVMPARADAEAAAAGAEAKAEAPAGEHLRNVHPATGCNVADDGRRRARRRRRVPPAAGLGAAAGGLPDDADPDVLPGREPRG